VAIVNALQLEGRTTSCQSLSALIMTPIPRLKSVYLSVAILPRFYCWYVVSCC